MMQNDQSLIIDALSSNLPDNTSDEMCSATRTHQRRNRRREKLETLAQN